MQLKLRNEMRGFIRDFFKEKPEASLSDCAKELTKAKLPIIPAIISEVRRQVTAERDHSKPTLVLVQGEKIDMKKIDLKLFADPPLVVKSEKDKLKERREYLDDLVMADPSITPGDAIQKVKEKFGRGTDPLYTIQSINAARELAGLQITSRQTKKTPAKPVREPMRFKVTPFMEKPSKKKAEAKKPPKVSTMWVTKGSRTQRYEVVDSEKVRLRLNSLIKAGAMKLK